MKICKTCGLPPVEHLFSGCKGKTFDEVPFELKSREGKFTQEEIDDFRDNQEVTIGNNTLLKK
jgi:hypothetical protein